MVTYLLLFYGQYLDIQGFLLILAIVLLLLLGASSFHTGIDIPAPAGTNIISIYSGTVTYIGFRGANGYTITIEKNSFSITYSHVSPDFLVYKNQNISKGSIIAQVGPLYVYGIANNPYKDKNGNPTNGATTGTHLHLTIKKDGQAVDPLSYFN